jgi:alkanesulfonate monooxygenase SsuD/methylene tetrahydromethanopterin reductase-like flavin-dependent oxidoreductase (luciferase family)
MRLSLLNFFSPPDEFLHLAQLVDEIDCFDRIWVGEHHTTDQVPAPFTLALLAAGLTERVRVGTGGVALILQNPYLLAETAMLAEMFYPGRVDLGVTKGGAAAAEVLELIRDGVELKALADSYDRKLTVLREILARSAPHADRFVAERVPMGPVMYSMGISEFRARRAGELGMGFVGSFHHDGTIEGIEAMFRIYRSAFTPSPFLAEPHAIVLVSGFVEADAERVAAALQRENEYRSDPRYQRSVTIFDAPVPAAAEMRRLAAAVAADEIMFLSSERHCEGCYRSLADGWRSTEPVAP